MFSLSGVPMSAPAASTNDFCTMNASVADGHRQEQGIGVLELDRDLVVAGRLHRVDGGEVVADEGLRVDVAFDREGHVVGRHRVAVPERHVVTQLEDVGELGRACVHESASHGLISPDTECTRVSSPALCTVYDVALIALRDVEAVRRRREGPRQRLVRAVTRGIARAAPAGGDGGRDEHGGGRHCQRDERTE